MTRYTTYLHDVLECSCDEIVGQGSASTNHPICLRKRLVFSEIIIGAVNVLKFGYSAVEELG